MPGAGSGQGWSGGAVGCPKGLPHDTSGSARCLWPSVVSEPGLLQPCLLQRKQGRCRMTGKVSGLWLRIRVRAQLRQPLSFSGVGRLEVTDSRRPTRPGRPPGTLRKPHAVLSSPESYWFPCGGQCRGRTFPVGARARPGGSGPRPSRPGLCAHAGGARPAWRTLGVVPFLRVLCPVDVAVYSSPSGRPVAVPGTAPFPVRLPPNHLPSSLPACASSATNTCASRGLRAHCFFADPVPCLCLCVLWRRRRRPALRVQRPPQLQLPRLLQGQLSAGQPCGKSPPALLPSPPSSSGLVLHFSVLYK